MDPAPLQPADGDFASLGLPKSLVEQLRRSDITSPFPIQTATIPDALTGRDVLGRGQTGSGKTLAFGLPMIATLAGAAGSQPRGLVLVPTRELAMQVTDVLTPLARTVDLRSSWSPAACRTRRSCERSSAAWTSWSRPPAD